MGIPVLISGGGGLSARISAETRAGSPEWERNAFGEGGRKHGPLILVHRGQTNDSQVGKSGTGGTGGNAFKTEKGKRVGNPSPVPLGV